AWKQGFDLGISKLVFEDKHFGEPANQIWVILKVKSAEDIEFRKSNQITIWVSSISFYSYADIAFLSSSDRGKGITDLKSALQTIFAETLVDSKDEFLQKFMVDNDFVRTNISEGEVLKHKAFKEKICDSNQHTDSSASNVEVVRLVGGNMATGQLYSHLIPLTLLLVDGSSPIDVTDSQWEMYVVCQKTTDQQGEIQYRVIGFSAVYRFYHYPDVSLLKQGKLSKKTHCPRLLPPLSAVEDVRKSLKINKQQFLQCWEVLIYIGLNPVDKYTENFVSIISNHVKYDILGKDYGTSGKQLFDVPSDDQEISFVMFRSEANEASNHSVII
ncbi:histone acetyltransferase type B catalytic subunit-like, partial [Vigna angularis]|uniref:histone acetyltransferase type B catalytic subunit-like n=1 Tax=Phaseolus angularis TaxID=3914 RepID=UPI0022B45F61